LSFVLFKHALRVLHPAVEYVNLPSKIQHKICLSGQLGVLLSQQLALIIGLPAGRMSDT
jgi:hypothetical protein